LQILNEDGHILPYSEIRHFLTSAAVYLAADQVKTPSGSQVPANVQFSPGCGQLAVAAAERTFSGKKLLMPGQACWSPQIA